MTIEEAIERNTNICSFMKEEYESDDHKAVKLSIEALKRYVDLRKYNIIPRWEKLPGETK